ncbi:signal peptidase II [Helicobacter cappadocius]|uniref:Lipoprotein signal peptidase n=1 Tax=Helicobacter cappadocius TaxID=3063998 RepID=A0AA90PS28_9HELI|nr:MULTISPECIES: signal peptidase II [unclassified Helicobacter]MDO7252572.1 signal peptidase II [Helicobacter sp. faydin-H75]MDP2538439.1 signal peptidase II [Helicobacter sp. faydin-H76]
MKKSLFIFIFLFLVIFVLDQWIKYLVVNGFDYQSEAVSIMLVYNKGVAFSMLSFLGSALKYIQIILVLVVWIMLLRQREFFIQNHCIFGIIFGAGCSNILDRFTYAGVVDYIHWHYIIEFPAVFNFADVMIDIGVGILILKMLFLSKTK